MSYVWARRFCLVLYSVVSCLKILFVWTILFVLQYFVFFGTLVLLFSLDALIILLYLLFELKLQNCVSNIKLVVCLCVCMFNRNDECAVDLRYNLFLLLSKNVVETAIRVWITFSSHLNGSVFGMMVIIRLF